MRWPARVEDVRDRVVVGRPRSEEQTEAVEGKEDAADHACWR